MLFFLYVAFSNGFVLMCSGRDVLTHLQHGFRKRQSVHTQYPQRQLRTLDHGHQFRSAEVVTLVSTDKHFAGVVPGDTVSSAE